MSTVLCSSESEETSKENSDGKDREKSSGRKSNRYHPYKERHGGSGDKKSSHRNRVFISNIPYDMKWQAIKDLMREKGNGCRALRHMFAPIPSYRPPNGGFSEVKCRGLGRWAAAEWHKHGQGFFFPPGRSLTPALGWNYFPDKDAFLWLLYL